MYNLLMNITNEMKLEIIHILKMKKFLGIEHISSINFTSQNSHTSILPNEMKSLEEYVNNCSLCTLYKSKESTFFSIGNENSDIFVIGLDYDFDDEKMFLIVKKCLKIL